MKIKVLHIIKSLGRGGAEMLLPETLRLHDKSRFEFHYIYFLPWKNQMVSAIEEQGGTVTCLNASNNIEIIFRLITVLRYIRRHRIDLIHCHLPWAGFLGRLVYLLSRKRVVYTEHNKQERYHRITFFLNKLTFNWQNLVISVSKDVENSIKENIQPKIPVKTILNGVNTHFFIRNEKKKIRRVLNEATNEYVEIPRDALVVGTIAVFRFQKRLKEWLQVFAQAAKNQPDLIGVIVGAGPLEGEIRQECHRLGLDDKVIMPGLQTNTREWYEVMDMFMMTSEFEGLPIALLEAMSMGCAVLATNAGGVGEVIESGKSGLLVPIQRWQELSHALEQLCDKRLRQKIGLEGRKRVIDKFSLSKMVNQLEKVYVRETGGTE